MEWCEPSASGSIRCSMTGARPLAKPEVLTSASLTLSRNAERMTPDLLMAILTC